MSIAKTLRRYRRKILGSGSPFRLLRKAALYTGQPVESISRLVGLGRLLKSCPAAVSDAVTAMERDGFARTDDALQGPLLAELAAEIDLRLKNHKPGADGVTERKFWSRLTTEADLHSQSVFVRFAMQENLLKMAAGYLGMVPYLSNVQVLVSFGTDNKVWEESQLWHRDYHDTKTLRLWVYLSDVLELKHGPFTYLPLELSRKVRNGFFPGRVSDAQMEADGLAANAESVYGQRLASFAIDTARCYHMGSRLPLGEIRVAYLATFNTHASLWPFYNDIRLSQGEALSPTQRLVLSPKS
jgi:hypothetical protein